MSSYNFKTRVEKNARGPNRNTAAIFDGDVKRQFVLVVRAFFIRLVYMVCENNRMFVLKARLCNAL